MTALMGELRPLRGIISPFICLHIIVNENLCLLKAIKKVLNFILDEFQFGRKRGRFSFTIYYNVKCNVSEQINSFQSCIYLSVIFSLHETNTCSNRLSQITNSCADKIKMNNHLFRHIKNERAWLNWVFLSPKRNQQVYIRSEIRG